MRTHCDYSPAISELCGTDVFLKRDFAQRTGSFKERGARNALLSLSDDEKDRGVVCASAGNHAQAMVGMSYLYYLLLDYFYYIMQMFVVV